MRMGGEYVSEGTGVITGSLPEMCGPASWGWFELDHPWFDMGGAHAGGEAQAGEQALDAGGEAAHVVGREHLDRLQDTYGDKGNFFETTVVNYTQSTSMKGSWDF